jgi:hypothetical protein
MNNTQRERISRCSFFKNLWITLLIILSKKITVVKKNYYLLFISNIDYLYDSFQSLLKNKNVHNKLASARILDVILINAINNRVCIHF